MSIHPIMQKLARHSWSESDGESLDPYAEPFCRDEVTQLMGQYENGENNQKRQDGYHHASDTSRFSGRNATPFFSPR